MNESNPTPPMLPTSSFDTDERMTVPLGTDPAEKEPVSGGWSTVEAMLRQPRRVLYHLKQPGSHGLVLPMLLIVLACALVYGFVVGTFSGGGQLWAAPVKVIAGLMISALICFPSLYIFSCLSGADGRPGEMFGLVAGLLAILSMLLVGFAPVAWLFSQSTQSACLMGGLHLIFWLVAAGFGIRFLRAGVRHMNARSTIGINVWVAIFLLVALQMTTALRPLLGTSSTFLPSAKEKKFFVAHWLDCLDKESKAGSETRADAR